MWPISPALKPKIRMWTSDVAASMSASIRGKNDGPSISSSQSVATAGAKSMVSGRRSGRRPSTASTRDRGLVRGDRGGEPLRGVRVAGAARPRAPQEQGPSGGGAPDQDRTPYHVAQG